MRKTLYEVHMRIDLVDGKKDYINLVPYTWHSERYGKNISVPAPHHSDGATGAPDILTRAWDVHDIVCERWKWDDGTPISVWQSSIILYDIFAEEHQPYRGTAWGSVTYVAQILKRPFRKEVGK